MAIVRTFNGASLYKPGSYSAIVVQNLTGFPLATTGVVGIIGEAAGGAPGVLDILSREGIQNAKTRYKSGNIPDALGPLVTPSNDPRVPNGASMIVVWKTNHGTQATAFLQNSTPANELLVTSLNYGQDENSDALTVAAGSILDALALIIGTIAGTYSISTSQTLILKVNGVTYTYTTTLNGGAITAAAVIADLNTGARWAPAKPVIAAANPLGTGVQITIDPTIVTPGGLEYGSIQVQTSTIATTLGFAGQNAGARGSRFFTTTKGTLSETSPELGGKSMLSLLYIGAGTAATAAVQTIGSQKSFTTACTGASGDNLNIPLTDLSGNSVMSLQQLVNQINAQPTKYTAVLLDANPNRNASDLDAYVGLNILTVAAQMYGDLILYLNWANTYSQYITLALTAGAVNQTPAMVSLVATPLFMTGGSLGTSANSDFQTGLAAFQTMRINTVVPLLSQNVGTLTVDSINALVAAHCALMWGTTGKSERQSFCSKITTKTLLQTAAQQLNSQYVQLVAQQVYVLNHAGTLTWFDPWMLACILAGMRQGAGTGTPLTFKTLAITNLRVLDGTWDPKIDYAFMIQNGLTIIEPMDTGGFRVVVDNTTYETDASFVWNRGSVVDASGYLAYDLRTNLEITFTGSKAKTGSSVAIKNFIIARMSIYLTADLIVGDDTNNGLGYKNLTVTVQGNTAIINITITPIQGLDFILPTMYLADIQQTAA